MPVLEVKQLVDQFILDGLVQLVLSVTGIEQLLTLFDQVPEITRLVTPALAQEIAQQGIADDAPGKGVFISGGFPEGREIPVVGNVMIIKDHIDGHVSHGPRCPRKGSAKLVDSGLFFPITRQFVRIFDWLRAGNKVPGLRRPHQQVHGHHLGERDQVIAGVGGCEHWLADATKETLGEVLVKFGFRQQFIPVVIGICYRSQFLAV